MIRYGVNKDDTMEVFFDDKKELIAFKTWGDAYTFLDIEEVTSLINVLLSFKVQIKIKRRLEKEFDEQSRITE